ncbi:phosphatase PAP2 family protein [Streptomyces sp. NPDC056309]|uniref:phosphatase PAP2 family protein n=1 Tax=unclassified Streptomyces TaxID=2593676 RepID=UPI0035E35D1A
MATGGIRRGPFRRLLGALGDATPAFAYTASMILALAAPVAVVATFAVNVIAKKLVAEVRPCYSMPHAYFVDACPARADYVFPSGHSTTAFATVAALWLLDRRLSAIAAAFVLFEGFTRVYLGDHYPHDVLGSAFLALPVAYLASCLLGRIAAPWSPACALESCSPSSPPPPPAHRSPADRTARIWPAKILGDDAKGAELPPLDGLLLDTTGWTQDEIDIGVGFHRAPAGHGT